MPSNVAMTVAVFARDAARAVQELHKAFIDTRPERARGRRPRRSQLLAESLRVG